MTQLLPSKTTLHTMTFSKTMIQTAIVKLKQNPKTIRVNVNLLNVVGVNVMAPRRCLQIMTERSTCGGGETWHGGKIIDPEAEGFQFKSRYP
jgi:hypothetical protein